MLECSKDWAVETKAKAEYSLEDNFFVKRSEHETCSQMLNGAKETDCMNLVFFRFQASIFASGSNAYTVPKLLLFTNNFVT